MKTSFPRFCNGDSAFELEKWNQTMQALDEIKEELERPRHREFFGWIIFALIVLLGDALLRWAGAF
jgi:hypothetical protein